MTHRPITTLFLLQSVDGKITTGASDALDFDRDFPRIPGLREGLHQYYEIEQTTDLWSLNSGRVQAKMGVNKKPLPEKTPVSFVILDNHHLTRRGVEYFCARSREFVLATSNPRHPAYEVVADNLHIFQQSPLCLGDLLRHLKEHFDCQRITVQTGGTLNGLLLREKLLDYVDVVVAPALVGGKDTASLADGPSLQSAEELSGVGVLSLESAQPLAHSYLRLKYRVIPLEDAPIEICAMDCGHPLWEKVCGFAEKCSWGAGPVLARKMRENAFESNERVLAAVCGEEVAGFATFSNRDELPPEYSFTPFVGFVFVDEKFRGRRLSEKLVNRGCEIAREQGFTKIYLLSGEKGLYEKYGFESLGDYPTVYGTMDQLFTKLL